MPSDACISAGTSDSAALELLICKRPRLKSEDSAYIGAGAECAEKGPAAYRSEKEKDGAYSSCKVIRQRWSCGWRD
jgi:hypothetical protein